jgi:hypothetical protein
MVEADEVDCEVAEKDRLSGGQANIAGVGESDGEGEESRVKGGESEAILSVVDEGLKASVGGLQAAASISS